MVAQIMAERGINPRTGQRLSEAERRAYAKAGAR